MTWPRNESLRDAELLIVCGYVAKRCGAYNGCFVVKISYLMPCPWQPSLFCWMHGLVCIKLACDAALLWSDRTCAVHALLVILVVEWMLQGTTRTRCQR